jgi:predicted nucleic acid-binding protein
VLVDVLRRDQRAVALLAAAEAVVASEITRYEILAGMHSHELEATERLFAELDWVDIGEPIARFAGALAREFGAAHSGIEDTDYLIAATALQLKAELVTTNVRHFPMFEGLEPAY